MDFTFYPISSTKLKRSPLTTGIKHSTNYTNSAIHQQYEFHNYTQSKGATNTLDEGAKIDPKIPEDEEPEDSLEPKRSEVKEDFEEQPPTCFLPSISIYLYFSSSQSFLSINPQMPIYLK